MLRAHDRGEAPFFRKVPLFFTGHRPESPRPVSAQPAQAPQAPDTPPLPRPESSERPASPCTANPESARHFPPHRRPAAEPVPLNLFSPTSPQPTDNPAPPRHTISHLPPHPIPRRPTFCPCLFLQPLSQPTAEPARHACSPILPKPACSPLRHPRTGNISDDTPPPSVCSRIPLTLENLPDETHITIYQQDTNRAASLGEKYSKINL